MIASEDSSAPPATANSPRNMARNICVQTGPFYVRIRPFAIFIKFMATFPLHNITATDGRDLKHRWISGILIYDFLFFMLVGAFFIITSVQMIEVLRAAVVKSPKADFFPFCRKLPTKLRSTIWSSGSGLRWWRPDWGILFSSSSAIFTLESTRSFFAHWRSITKVLAPELWNRR